MNSKEIIASRTVGFGGSDAEMFYDIALKGLSAINVTCKKRIRVAKGIDEYKPISTPAMQKGHDFEDWYAKQPFAPLNFEREKKIEKPLAANFKTFAHADFFSSDSVSQNSEVWELKCVSDPDNCMNDYIYQLQWYYMMGVNKVWLVVCDSRMPSFQDGVKMPVLVYRNENIIDMLKSGISILDKNWENVDLSIGDEWTDGDLMPFEQNSILMLRSYLEQIAELEKQAERHRELIRLFMEQNNIRSITSDTYNITYVPESTTSTLDKSKLFKEHPEINEQDFLKVSKKKSYIKISLK